MTPGEIRIFGKALGAIARSQDSLGDEQRGWLRQVSLRRGVEAFDACPDWTAFEFVLGPEVEATDAEVQLLGGDDWASFYWQLVRLCLIARTLQGPRTLDLPPSVEAFLVADLDRIVDAAASGASVPDPLANEGFLADVAVCRGIAIPMDTCYGVPVWMAGGIQGFGPGLWLQMHLRAVELRGFGPETITAVTPLNFDLHLANPHLMGWFGVSWLLDPRLAEVAPHLTWYRELLLQAGAHIAPVGSHELTIAHATATSETRRGMFERGQYQPTDYVVVMAREVGLRWHETTAGLLPAAGPEP